MTLDEFIVKVAIDATGVKQGAKEAVAATSAVSKQLVDAADKGEKAQTDSLAIIARAWNALAATQRKTAEAAVQSGKAMVAATDNVANSTEKIIRSVGALLLLFAGAKSLKSFTTDMIGLDAAVGRTAQNLGQTPERLSAIGRAAERMGGTFSGAVGGLQGLSDAFNQLRTTGNSAIMEPLARLQGLSGKAVTFGKDAHANLLSIADALHSMKDQTMADFLGRQILGDQGLVDVARRGGSAGILAEEAKSPKITKQQTEYAQKLQAQLTEVRQNFEQIGNAILLDFGPAMVSGLKWVKDLIEANRELIETKVKEWVQAVGKWFAEHRDDIANFGKAVGDVANAAGTLATAFAKQSPAMMALEAFGLLMGGRVLGAVSAVVGAMKVLGGLALPTWAASMLGLSGVMLGAGGAAGAMGVGHTDEYGRDAGTWAGDGPERDHAGTVEDPSAHLRHRKAKSPPTPAGRVWRVLKNAVGLGDNGPGAGVSGVSPDTKLSDLDTKQRADLITALAKSEGNPGARPDYNNPGNIKWGLWTRAHGATEGGIAGVAKFPTAEVGRAAVEALLFGKSYRNLTIRQAMNKYAPKGDGANNPDAKAAFIAGRIGAPSSPGTPADTAQPNPQQPFATEGGMIAGDLSGKATYSHGQIGDVKGFIIHHTAGRGTPESVVDTLNQRGLGVQYVMDRDGKIFRTLPDGARGAHIRHSDINDLSNANSLGMEVIAKDDKDVTPAQVAAGKAFLKVMQKRYPGLQVFGHGEVNPGHRPLTEGHSIVQAYRDGAGKPDLDPSYRAPATPMGQRTLQGYMGRDLPPVTVDHAMRHVLKVLADSRRLTAHNDNKPMAVTPVDGSGNPLADLHKWRFDAAMKHQHAAALGRMAHVAGLGAFSHHTVNHIDRSSETKIGSIAVHTAATDARGIAADIEPHLHRGQAAGRADYGLA